MQLNQSALKGLKESILSFLNFLSSRVLPFHKPFSYQKFVHLESSAISREFREVWPMWFPDWSRNKHDFKKTKRHSA